VSLRGVAGWGAAGFAVLVSAILAVADKHESRNLFVELQRLERERDELNVTWERLKVEGGYLASHDRIRSLAERRLGMDRPASNQIAVINVEY